MHGKRVLYHYIYHIYSYYSTHCARIGEEEGEKKDFFF
jgi:hypothetical protein